MRRYFSHTIFVKTEHPEWYTPVQYWGVADSAHVTTWFNDRDWKTFNHIWNFSALGTTTTQIVGYTYTAV